jgi:RyR domain-containing protein
VRVEQLSQPQRPSRTIIVFRFLFVVDVVLAAYFGYRGMEQFVATLPPAQYGHGFLNTAYYTLQLFVLGADPLQQQAGPYPWMLNAARFMAPAATVYALFEAIRALFAGQLLRWYRRRLKRRHVIVTGDTTAARAIAAKLRAAGLRVAELSDGGVEALRAAGVGGAGEVFACADDADESITNVSTALAAASVKRHRLFTPRLRVHAQVSDSLLALSLRARRLGLPEAKHVDVDFFTVEELAARALMDQASVAVNGAPHILVAGLGTFGQAVVVEYAQSWRLNAGRPGERVKVTLVDERAEAVARELSARWDILDEVVDLVPVQSGLEAAVVGLDPAPHRAYLCYEDEDLALRTALTVTPLWRGGPGSLVVRLNRLARSGEAFRTGGRNLLDNVDSRLRLVGVTDLGCEPEVVRHDLVERLGRAIHERYLVQARWIPPAPVRLSPVDGSAGRRARKPAPAAGSLQAWDVLAENFKLANRGQANDIGIKLRKIGATVAPRLGAAEPFEFTPAEVETLAEHEHVRWCEERTTAGWTYASVRNDARKQHSSLVPWRDLPDSERQKDRDAVRNIPAVLAEVGLQPVRIG